MAEVQHRPDSDSDLYGGPGCQVPETLGLCVEGACRAEYDGDLHHGGGDDVDGGQCDSVNDNRQASCSLPVRAQVATDSPNEIEDVPVQRPISDDASMATESSVASSRYPPSLIRQNNELGKKFESGASSIRSSSMTRCPLVLEFGINFLLPLPETYKCSVCLEVLWEPVQTGCGHRFCRRCIAQVQKGQNPACPVDRSPLGTVFPDKHCEREIGNLDVKCSFVGECQWTGTLYHLSNHLEFDCEFAPVECPNAQLGCKKKVERSLLAQHLRRECDFRKEACGLCGDLVIFFLMTVHVNTHCPEVEVVCQQGSCGKVMRRKRMEQHVRNECLGVEEPCELGCGKLMKRGDMQEHVKDQPGHVAELYVSCRELKKDKEEQGVIIQEQRGRIITLESAVENLTAMVKQFHLTMNHDMADQTKSVQRYRHDVDQAVAGLHTSSEAATVRVQRNEGRVRDLATRQESDSREMKEKLTTLEVDYKRTYDDLDLRAFELENTTFNGVLTWKFQGFQKHLDNAKRGVKTSHYSQPFYSSPQGYKMCARVYPNGDGAGHGKYVSIFFVIMAGQYDAILKWPFSQRVTLSLMDQSPDRRNVSETFMPDIRSTSFQQPTAGMNVASGCPCFAAHSLLMGSTSYLKNDTIYLRVKVDTQGLDI